MTNLSKWDTPSLQTVLSTGLNALGAGGTGISSTIDNTVTSYTHCDIEVFINYSSGTPSSTATVVIYFIEAVDGTNFDVGFVDCCYNDLAVQIPIGQTTATPQRVVARNIPLPPAKFQVELGNNTNISFGATGNTCKLLMYGYNLNG